MWCCSRPRPAACRLAIIGPKSGDAPLPTIGTQKVSVKTENGFVRVRPAAEGGESIEIRAEIRAVAPSPTEAEECLHAIEITSPVSGPNDATQEIGWAWREPKKSGWRAAVSFEISMPHALPLEVQTTNGQIDVVGLTGDCQIRTENGAVRLVAAENQLKAESHNGSITVESPAVHDVHLHTVNGSIRATLTARRRNGPHLDAKRQRQAGPGQNRRHNLAMPHRQRQHQEQPFA